MNISRLKLTLVFIAAFAALMLPWRYASAGALVVSDSSGNVGTLETETGALSFVANPSGVGAFTDIAFTPDGKLYGITFDSLYLIDRTANEATHVGSWDSALELNALVVDARGAAYAMGPNDMRLHSLDLSSGAATSIFDTGYASSGDLEFFGGSLYLSSEQDSLVQIDLATQASLEIGPIGFAAVYGLASLNGILYGFAGNDFFPIDEDSGAYTSPVREVGNDFSAVYGAATDPVSDLRDFAVAKAKSVVGTGYWTGGKGWDFSQSPGRFLSTEDLAAAIPYQIFDSSPDTGSGLDCSGLVFWAYNSSFDPDVFESIIGYQSADGIYRNNTASEPIEPTSKEPGDLMFFDWGADFNCQKDGIIDHVAFYVGPSQTPSGEMFDVVEAASPSLDIITSESSFLETYRINADEDCEPGFVGYKRVIDPRVALRITTHSPIDVIVSDPDGITIGPASLQNTWNELKREVPGQLYYTIVALEPDGTPRTEVVSPIEKKGKYVVYPLVRGDVDSSARFGITFQLGGDVLTLAEDVSAAEMSPSGYAVRVTDTGVEQAEYNSVDVPSLHGDTIQRAYIAYYGRPGDPLGVIYWALKLATVDGNLDSLISAFGTSAEYTMRFSGLSDLDLVNNIYLNLFNRFAEPEGLDWYLNRLSDLRQEWTDRHEANDAGATEYALSRIALDILNGAQNVDSSIIDNKMTVAWYFTAQIEENGVNYSSSDVEEAMAVLELVDGDAASIETAIAAVNAFVL